MVAFTELILHIRVPIRLIMRPLCVGYAMMVHLVISGIYCDGYFYIISTYQLALDPILTLKLVTMYKTISVPISRPRIV